MACALIVVGGIGTALSPTGTAANGTDTAGTVPPAGTESGLGPAPLSEPSPPPCPRTAEGP